MLPLGQLISNFASTTAQAACPGDAGTNCDTGLPAISASSTSLQGILQIVFGILAAITVLVIVIAALKFVTAQGNPQEVAKARNTIIYSIIGLAVAISGEVFVSFVLGRL